MSLDVSTIQSCPPARLEDEITGAESKEHFSTCTYQSAIYSSGGWATHPCISPWDSAVMSRHAARSYSTIVSTERVY